AEGKAVAGAEAEAAAEEEVNAKEGERKEEAEEGVEVEVGAEEEGALLVVQVHCPATKHGTHQDLRHVDELLALLTNLVHPARDVDFKIKGVGVGFEAEDNIGMDMGNNSSASPPRLDHSSSSSFHSTSTSSKKSAELNHSNPPSFNAKTSSSSSFITTPSDPTTPHDDKSLLHSPTPKASSVPSSPCKNNTKTITTSSSTSDIHGSSTSVS
ncbi:hypothetical protein B484DRAFT_459534, partial [Ochromonadaceae sp. CCMP2298]